MFKKLLIASVVLAASTGVAFASHHHNGDYKGEQAAPVTYKDQQPCPTYTYLTGGYLGASVGPRVNVAGSPLAYEGIEGTIFGGYGAMVAPSFHLAGELFVQDSANVKDFKSAGNLTGVRSSWGFGASILPGYMINDHVLGFVRAGVVRTRFSDTGVRSNATGWQLGAGMQTSVYENLDVRGEYVFSDYQKITSIGRPVAHQVNVGLVYKFL